jgi:hypothetical protein
MPSNARIDFGYSCTPDTLVYLLGMWRNSLCVSQEVYFHCGDQKVGFSFPGLPEKFGFRHKRSIGIKSLRPLDDDDGK